MVDLWFRGNEANPGGFRSTFETADEAIAQAADDIRNQREPGPDRVVDGDSVVADRAALEQAAASEA